MITLEDAKAQGEMLVKLGQESPVRQYRYELRRRGKEWLNAAETFSQLGSLEDPGAIELAGSIGAGMRAFYPTRETNWAIVIRTMQRDGQLSIHVEDDDGRPQYLNLFGPSSPVVVKA